MVLQKKQVVGLLKLGLPDQILQAKIIEKPQTPAESKPETPAEPKPES